MIEGITILNQTEIIVLSYWFQICFFVGLIIAVGFMIVGIINIDKTCGVVLAITSLVMFVALLVMTWLSPVFEKPSGRYKYECLIDKSVSMTEVHEKYEVIEQRGDIWVLEDKEQ